METGMFLLICFLFFILVPWCVHFRFVLCHAFGLIRFTFVPLCSLVVSSSSVRQFSLFFALSLSFFVLSLQLFFSCSFVAPIYIFVRRSFDCVSSCFSVSLIHPLVFPFTCFVCLLHSWFVVPWLILLLFCNDSFVSL